LDNRRCLSRCRWADVGQEICYRFEPTRVKGLKIAYAKPAPQRISDCNERNTSLSLRASARQQSRTLQNGQPTKVSHQPSLTDACLAHDDDAGGATACCCG
jgi:hypothetical protein